MATIGSEQWRIAFKVNTKENIFPSTGPNFEKSKEKI